MCNIVRPTEKFWRVVSHQSTSALYRLRAICRHSFPCFLRSHDQEVTGCLSRCFQQSAQPGFRLQASLCYGRLRGRIRGSFAWSLWWGQRLWMLVSLWPGDYQASEQDKTSAATVLTQSRLWTATARYAAVLSGWCCACSIELLNDRCQTWVC